MSTHVGGIIAGSTSVRHTIVGVSGSTAAGWYVEALRSDGTKYTRDGSIGGQLNDLPAINSAYTPYGLKQFSSVGDLGSFIFHLPDAWIAIGADWVALHVFSGDATTIYRELIPLVADPVAQSNAAVASVNAYADTKATAVIDGVGGMFPDNFLGMIIDSFGRAVTIVDDNGLRAGSIVDGALIPGKFTGVFPDNFPAMLIDGATGHAIVAVEQFTNNVITPAAIQDGALTSAKFAAAAINGTIAPALVPDNTGIGNAAASAAAAATAATTAGTKADAAKTAADAAKVSADAAAAAAAALATPQEVQVSTR